MGRFQVQGLQVGNVSEYDYREAEMEIELELSLGVGDRIHIIGSNTDFIQLVESMTYDGDEVERGRAAQTVRVPVKYHVCVGDAIILLPPREGDEDGPAQDGLGLWGRRRG